MLRQAAFFTSVMDVRVHSLAKNLPSLPDGKLFLRLDGQRHAKAEPRKKMLATT